MSDVFEQIRRALPGWRHLERGDVTIDAPRGFSSFTGRVVAPPGCAPPAIFYRRLEGKDNAILDPAGERAVFRLLSAEGIAAPVFHDGADYRLEGCYDGRSLTAEDLFDEGTLAKIAAQIWRFHQIPPPAHLPPEGFFTLLHRKWGRLARRVLDDPPAHASAEEREMCVALRHLVSEDTRRRVARLLPDEPLIFAHNDVYHGNIMRLEGGAIRLLDFEFSCRGHRAFDFSNLFAETVMQHGLPEPPHFRIGEPAFGERELRWLIGAYLDRAPLGAAERARRLDALVAQTRALIPLSHYMYAMAALPLAAAPIQKIQFIPYALQRFERFLAS